MTILSLILFVIYLDVGKIPIYIPLIPVIIVCLLIMESALFSNGVSDGFFIPYIIFGAICALISLILLSIKWSHPEMIKDGWYIIHLPCFVFYLVSFILHILFAWGSGIGYIFHENDEQFQKILWVQGVLSLFTFHFLLIIKLDVAIHLMKFVYCFLPLWIWEISNLPIVARLFADSFIWWKYQALPTLTISPSKRRELELQKYVPLPLS